MAVICNLTGDCYSYDGKSVQNCFVTEKLIFSVKVGGLISVTNYNFIITTKKKIY